MKASELTAALPCRSLWDGWEDRNIAGGYTSDLLSDVMAHGEEDYVFITIQAHKNSVAVATLKDLAAVIIASDRPVPEDMIEAARNEDLPIFVSSEDQFTCSWKLHQALVSSE